MPASDLFSQPLSRLRARYAQTPLPRFLRWWGGELSALLPERWSRALAVEHAWLALEVQGEELVATVVDGRGPQEAARLALAEREALGGALEAALDDERRALPRILMLPAAAVLRRAITLPAAALDNLRTVLGFELDRQTPFKPDQVFYDSRVLRSDAAAKQIVVELALVPKERLQQALAGIDGVAATLAGVDLRGPDGSALGYNFLPAEQRRSRRNTRSLIHAGLIAASALFLFLAMGKVLDNRAAAVEALTAESEQRHDEARAAAKLRDSLEEAALAANFLAIEKSRQPSMVLMLNEITRLLPDDTYLERLNATRGEITLSGQSSQAAKLVEILQASTLLRSPALSGPIMPDARTGKDRFNITAGYGPAPEPEK
jgi:general secretion pathway protein L